MSSFISIIALWKKLQAMTPCVLLLTPCIATQVQAQAGLDLRNRNCLKLYDRFKTSPKHKAFAVSNTALDSSAQSCGTMWSAASKAAAEAGAMRACKNPHVGGSCRISLSE
jgi:hypothetical protein